MDPDLDSAAPRRGFVRAALDRLKAVDLQWHRPPPPPELPAKLLSQEPIGEHLVAGLWNTADTGLTTEAIMRITRGDD